MSEYNPNQPVRREYEFISPTDQIRWGPILAGLFAALSAMIVLTVLGIAVGLTAYDANDPARAFGIGAGIWGAISALISFFLGGWVAARGAAFRGSKSSVMNGALVWAVAIPIMVYMVGSTLGQMAGTAAQTGASMQQTSSVQEGQTLGDRAQSAAAQLREQAGQISSQDVDRAATTGAKGAWGTLVALLLGLAASSLGGYAGARHRDANLRTATTP